MAPKNQVLTHIEADSDADLMHFLLMKNGVSITLDKFEKPMIGAVARIFK